MWTGIEWTIPSPASSGKLLPFAETERSIFVTPPAHFGGARSEGAMGEPTLSTDGYAERADRMGLPSRARLTLNDATIRRALERISDLSALEEQLLFRLCCLSLLQGYAWIGQAALAELLRCSERTLRDVTKDVAARGLLVTVRMRDGLRYFPQWEELGLTPASKEERSANPAGLHRQILPMHYRSTKGSNKTDSSRARVRATPAAAYSFQAPPRDSEAPKSGEAESPPQGAVPATVAPLSPELGAVLDRFGPEAARDVQEVLQSKVVLRQPQAGQVALERLLRMSPDTIRTSPGACFHGFVRLALDGKLAPPPTEPVSRTTEPEPLRELSPERLAWLRARRSELFDSLERVGQDGEKAAPLRAELRQISAQLPLRGDPVQLRDMPYAARDGNTGRTMVEAVLKLLRAPQRVVAVTASQLSPQEATELVVQYAPTHPQFAAAIAAQLAPDNAQELASRLDPRHIQELLGALEEFDPEAASRLSPHLRQEN